MARGSHALEQGEFGYTGHRGEDNKEKIYNIARHVLSGPPTVVPDTASPYESSISPEGFRGSLACLGTRRVRDKTRTLHDIQERAIELQGDVSNLPT